MISISAFKIYLQLYFKSLSFIWSVSRRTVTLLLMTIPIQAFLPSVTISVTNYLMDTLNLSHGKHTIVLLLLVWGLAFLLNNIMTPFNTMIQGELTDTLTFEMSKKIMEKSSDLQTIDYFENHEFYNDIQMLSSQINWRPVNLLVFGTSLISNLLLFLSMLWLFAGFHILISLLMLLALIPQTIVSYRIQQQAFEVLVSNSEESRKLEYYSQTVLSADTIKDVRLNNLYDFFIGKYERVFVGIRDSVQKKRMKQFLTSLFFLALAAFFSISSFLYVIWQVEAKMLGVGSIMVFATSMIYSVTSMSRLVEDSSLLYDTLLYMEKFFKFLSLKTENIGKLEVPDHFIQLDFYHLNFSYAQSDTPVLKDVTFSVKAGERIAIVGENGAGKSTLIKLLCRFYPLTEGDIRLDGQSIYSYNPLSYRKLLSAIFQDFAKFDLSLYENVSLIEKERGYQSEKIQKALKDSGLEDELVSDLEQVLGKKFEDGQDLSGGQWQKVALARAFLSQAPILILDEPTAALDAKTEYELFQHFLELTQGKTVFFITHRLASVKQADKILVLKEGRVHAFDSHKNLMKENGYYRDLYQMQSSLYFEETK